MLVGGFAWNGPDFGKNLALWRNHKCQGDYTLESKRECGTKCYCEGRQGQIKDLKDVLSTFNVIPSEMKSQ